MSRGTPFTTGQLGKLQTIFNTAVATALPKIAAKFDDPKAVMRALENKTELLSGHLGDHTVEVITRMMACALPRLERVSLTTSAQYDSSSLELSVHPDDRHWVGHGFPKAKPVPAGTVINFDIHEVPKKDMLDAEIEYTLPRRFLDESVVNAIIVETLKNQPYGGPGRFPIDRSILIYRPGSVVEFWWYEQQTARSVWRINTHERRERQDSYNTLVHHRHTWFGWKEGTWVLTPAN